MATPTPSESDIPGYYYDSSTKRYFKQPPIHFSKLLKIPDTAQPSTTGPGLPVKRPPHDLSLYKLTQKRQEVFHSISSDRTLVSKHLAGSLRCSDQVPLKPELEEQYDREVERVMVSKDGKMVIVANSLDYDCIHRDIGLSCGSVKCSTRSDLCVHWEYFEYGIIEQCDVCDYIIDENSVEKDIITVVVGQQEINRVGMLSVVPYTNDFAPDPSAVCISPYKADSVVHVFAVGTERGSVHVLNDEENISLPVPKKYRCPVRSLAFADEGKLVYAGYQKGDIYGWDLREGSPKHCLHMREPKEGKKFSCIAALQALGDMNYMISNAYNSKLSLWDMRMCKKVLQYKGHVNDYRPCRSPLIDQEEKFVFTVGSDNCVRVWSLGDGQLLHTITPSDYKIPDEDGGPPPVITYTDILGGRYDPTLIVCSHKELTFFRL